jgi:hypothetical protein
LANRTSISALERGSLVLGFKSGRGWEGISANILYHCLGILSSGNVIFLVVFIAVPYRLLYKNKKALQFFLWAFLCCNYLNLNIL